LKVLIEMINKKAKTKWRRRDRECSAQEEET